MLSITMSYSIAHISKTTIYDILIYMHDRDYSISLGGSLIIPEHEIRMEHLIKTIDTRHVMA